MIIERYTAYGLLGSDPQLPQTKTTNTAEPVADPTICQSPIDGPCYPDFHSAVLINIPGSPDLVALCFEYSQSRHRKHQQPTKMFQLLSPKSEVHLGSQCPQTLPETYNLEDLVSDIKAHLGDSSGIDSSDVDPNYLISLVQKYVSDPADWLRFFQNDPSKNYTRNAIENINQKANIVSRSLYRTRIQQIS